MKTSIYNPFETLITTITNDHYLGHERGYKRRTTMPKANVAKHEDRYVIELAAPGYSRNDFNIKIENDTMTIAVEGTETREKLKDIREYNEFGYGNFERTWYVPEGVKKESIVANYNAGILTVELPIEKSKGSIKVEVT
jgi:HSP20 family protein